MTLLLALRHIVELVEKTGYQATVPDANTCISAFGRLWAADTTSNNATVYFSDLISGHVWSTGTAGSLNVNNVWVNGADQITGLAAHNGFLFIFGKRQILGISRGNYAVYHVIK